MFTQPPMLRLAPVLLLLACRSLDPMGTDFRSAVSIEREAPLTEAGNASVLPFVSEYREAAVQYLGAVLVEDDCAREGRGLRNAWAAVRALTLLPGPRARALLEAMAQAKCVDPALRWQVRRVLAARDGRSTALVAVEELGSRQGTYDARLVLEILASGDASTAPRLAELADLQAEVRDRAFLRFLGLVMATPSECRLSPHGSVPLAGGEYVCRYTCPSEAMFHQRRQASACAVSVPLVSAVPQRRAALATDR